MKDTLRNPQTVGYLAVVNVPQLGYCGGLLQVNLNGRPVEFHCTSPIIENRAQRILYGKTYEPFLFCDQIGRALVDKARERSRLLFIRQPQLSPLAQVIDQPLLQMINDERDETTSDSELKRFSVAGFEFEHQIDDLHQSDVVVEVCHALAKAIPLDEPFARIRMAIDEAQAIAR